jgi:Flp pilus assembly protein TadD
MAIAKFSGPKAVETLKSNKFSTWPARQSDLNRVEPVAKPFFRPSFKLLPGASILTIGSCFARNVENALLARGFDLPSRRAITEDEEFKAIGPGVLNNYSVPSIYNELAWALDPEVKFVEEDNFFEIFTDKYVDVHLNHGLKPDALEVVRKRRAAIRASYAELPNCQTIIITLGLTECWLDTKTQLYLNTAPRRSMIREEPERFELHVLDYRETIRFLDMIMELIQRYGRKDRKLILTVSPVPLSSTYRDMDVMVANTYSKAVLRVAAEEIVSRYDFVDYYPSYESITLSARDVAWRDDLVHVQNSIVDINVSRMVEGYVGGSSDHSIGSEEYLAWLTQSLDQAPARVVDELNKHLEQFKLDPRLAALGCEAAVKLRRPHDAQTAFAYIDNAGDPALAQWLQARIAALNGDHTLVAIALAACEERYSKRQPYWDLLVNAHFQLGDVAAALEATKRWAKTFARSAEPYRVAGVGLARAGDFATAEVMFRKAVLIADEDPKVLLDYSDLLISRHRLKLAQSMLARVAPQNPAQQTRKNELLEQLPARLQL